MLDKLSPSTKGLLALVLIDLVVVNGFLLIVQPERTNLHLLPSLWSAQLTDSWYPMRQGYDYLIDAHQQPVYTHLLLGGQTKFQYPPTSLLLVLIIERVTQFCGLDFYQALRDLSFCFLLILIPLVDSIYRFTAKVKQVADVALSYGAWVLLVVSFYPIMRAFHIGQIQLWLDALFAALFFCWLRGNFALAGIINGFMCLIKPQYALALVWALLRKEKKFALSMAATVLIGVSLSVELFGLPDHLDYLKALSFISQHGESYYLNQSVNGVLNRLLHNGPNLEWLPTEFAPYNTVVYYGTMVSSALLILAALWPWAKKTEPAADVRHIDLCILFLTCTVASPIAWDHHYGLLLPMFAFAYPIFWSRKLSGVYALSLLILSYILTANLFVFAMYTADGPFNFLQSYIWFGALIFLVLLYRLRARLLN